MADVAITAANVVSRTGAQTVLGTAGATITAGQVVYQDPADGKYKLADCDNASAAVRSPAGIALNGASNDQPLVVQTSGELTLGGGLTVGTTYYLSPNPGGIAPIADLGSGDFPTILGIAISSSVLRIDMVRAGVALA